MHSCSIASVIPTKRLIGKPHSNRSGKRPSSAGSMRSEEHTSELQSPCNLVCRLLLEKKKYLLNNTVDISVVIDPSLLLVRLVVLHHSAQHSEDYPPLLRHGIAISRRAYFVYLVTHAY